MKWNLFCTHFDQLFVQGSDFFFKWTAQQSPSLSFLPFMRKTLLKRTNLSLFSFSFCSFRKILIITTFLSSMIYLFPWRISSTPSKWHSPRWKRFTILGIIAFKMVHKIRRSMMCFFKGTDVHLPDFLPDKNALSIEICWRCKRGAFAHARLDYYIYKNMLRSEMVDTIELSTF